METKVVFKVNNTMSDVCNENSGEQGVELEDALDKAGHGRYSYCLLLTCCIIQLGASVDMFGFSLVVPAAKCDLNLDLKKISLINSMPFAGFLFAIPWGYFADTCGRRRALLLSSSVGFILAVLNSFSTNFYMMLLLKFLGCSFSTSSLTITINYLGECTGIKHRNKYVLLQNCFNLAADIYFFALGLLILPLNFNLPIPWLSVYRPWRLMALMMAVPLGLGAFMMAFLHESPKFLANQGQMTKSLQVLSAIFEANGGKKGNYPVKELIATNQMESCSLWESMVKQITPVFQPPLLWRTIQLIYLFSICFSTNNVFFMWFPTIVNSFYNSPSEVSKDLSFCEKIIANISTSAHIGKVKCNDDISNNTIYSGTALGLFLVVLNLVISRLASWRRAAIMIIFLLSGISAILLNLVFLPEASIALFFLVQCTGSVVGNIGSYFLDIYPTSYSGFATSFSVMMGRFVCLGGINLVGITMLNYCTIIFYFWSAYVLSGVGVAVFLPADKP